MRYPTGWATAAAFSLAAVVGAAPAIAAEVPEEVEYCLMCHSDEMTMELEDGGEMSIAVDPDSYMTSVHGDELLCTDCHDDPMYVDEHPTGRTFASQRDYELLSSEICKTCHFETYTRTLDSVHAELRAEGLEIAPICTDCHGAHDIADPHRKQAMVSRSCGTCHDDVYEVYAESVHGAALASDDPSVPGCADCHTAHSIADPDTLAFRLRSPERCIDCHGDEAMMEPYGLTPTVATTYLTDFHGVTASIAAGEEEIREEEVTLVCTDCHGYHDIRSTASMSDAELKAQVADACASCHEDAPPDFPATWLSHYPPSLSHAPLVFLIDGFYEIFIPFMVIGLVLQVLLHLYRVGLRR